MPTLKKNDGTTLSAAVTALQNRAVVKAGHGTVTTPGSTGHDVVTVTSAKNAAYTAATPSAPIALGPGADDIAFLPVTYP